MRELHGKNLSDTSNLNHVNFERGHGYFEEPAGQALSRSSK
jgi:hypothetical protein